MRARPVDRIEQHVGVDDDHVPTVSALPSAAA
jgi:hypothetical protein